MTKGQPVQPSETPESKKRIGRPAGGVYFPHNSLKEALKIPTTIWEKGGGKPFALQDVADYTLTSTGTPYSPTSSAFSEIVRSANRYGLIEGSYQQKVSATISLSPLGRSIVAPTPNVDVNASMRTALETPEVFRKFLESLHGVIIPPEQVCINTLIIDCHVRREDAKICYDVLMQNIAELNISKVSQGKTYLRLDNLSAITQAIKTTEEGETSTPEEEEQPDGFAKSEPQTQKTTPQDEIVKVPCVFISHSKNKSILSQIKQVLDFGNFKYVIAEEKETTAIPLPDKVFDLMWDCNCAIINISADEEKKDGESYGLNENVIAELWGAYLHYKKNVILVIDKRLKEKLPSILQGLTAIFYEGDELSWPDGMRLQKALSEFRNKL